MKNFEIYCSMADDSVLTLEFDSGSEIIHRIIGDDYGAPPVVLVIKAVADDGKVVHINVPFSESNEIKVIIEEQ